MTSAHITSAACPQSVPRLWTPSAAIPTPWGVMGKATIPDVPCRRATQRDAKSAERLEGTTGRSVGPFCLALLSHWGLTASTDRVCPIESRISSSRGAFSLGGQPSLEPLPIASCAVSTSILPYSQGLAPQDSLGVQGHWAGTS